MQDAMGSVNNFLRFAEQHGYKLTNFNPDGKIHRFRHGNRDNGWYVGYLNFSQRLQRHFLVAEVGDWISGEKFQYKDGLDEQEIAVREEVREKMAAQKLAMETAQQRKYEDVALTAERDFDNFREIDSHNYLNVKKIDKPYKCRIDKNGNLIVPMYIGNKMWGYQTIFPNGKKLYLSGQKFKGTYFIIGEVDEGNLYLCEGFSTGASIHMATARPVIVAFSASNLPNVAEQFRGYSICVAGDNDRFNVGGNAGETFAKKAADILGCRYVLPKFKDESTKPTDFNDLHVLEGLEEARKQLMSDSKVGPTKDLKRTKAIVKAEIYRELANVINQASFAGKHPLKERFYLIEPEPGKKTVVQDIGNRTVRYVDSQAVVNAVMKYIEERLADQKKFALTHRDATECVRYWMAVTEPINMPIYLGEKDAMELCFQRLSFNYTDIPKETLVLDELLSRCTNIKAIKQFIGSLTVENSSKFQYLWVYGDGGEGKGSFGRGLAEIFGTGCVMMPVPRSESSKQFLAYSLQGKRLCIFPECSNYSFPNDPLFKQLTGGDHIWFEAKGKMGFCGTLNSKFIYLSNDRPAIQGTGANLRRVIYSQISKATTKYPAAVYDSLIKAEMPSFIIKCRQEYLEACPYNEDIRIDDETTKALIDVNEEEFEVLTSKWFIPSANEYISPARLQEIKSLEKLSFQTYRQWVEYMRLNVGLQSVIVKDTCGTRLRHSRRMWQGVRERSDVEQAAWVNEKNTPVEIDDNGYAVSTQWHLGD